MREQIAIVTPDESQLFRDIQATPSYDRTRNHLLETDPRFLPGDIISYTALVIVAAETLIEDRHGPQSIFNTFPRKWLRRQNPPKTSLLNYTITDLPTTPMLNTPPLILENPSGPLPTSFSVAEGEHLLGFAAALQEQPEVDETDFDSQIAYILPTTKTADAALVAKRAQTGRDPLASSLASLLRLQQLCDRANGDVNKYGLEGFLNLPHELTMTTRTYHETGMTIITKKTVSLLIPGSQARLGRALLEVWNMKQPEPTD